MHLLFCCDLYYPSVGGVQEVIRQIAERMVRRGHQVTVATRRLGYRQSLVHNGVTIAEFEVSGDIVHGLQGEVERYRQFVAKFPADAILIKAALQWSFDALWPVLDCIRPRKVFIPCGFSSFYDPEYTQYFKEMPDILGKFDHLIFYAEDYRDIDLVRAHGLDRYSLVPNGANEAEFEVEHDGADLRRRLGIGEEVFLFSTVGSFTGVKGHLEVAEAFARLDSNGRDVALVLNGNFQYNFQAPPSLRERIKMKLAAIGQERSLKPLAAPLVQRMFRRRRINSLDRAMARAAADPHKTVITVNLPRNDVVSLFFSTDLFVFASRIEYSPLVLFESAAAGTPFLTVPVGNAADIAAWTGAGRLCPAAFDEQHRTITDPAVLAREMKQDMEDVAALTARGKLGRERWRKYFTWNRIANAYEQILKGETPPPFFPARTDIVAKPL